MRSTDSISTKPPNSNEGYCYFRSPCGSLSARQFGVALVQEFDNVHDLEPLFYANFGNDDSALEGSLASAAYGEHKLCALNSPDFTFRLLRFLREKGVIEYNVPHVSPLLELDEDIINACKEEVAEKHSRLAELVANDNEDEDTQLTLARSPKKTGSTTRDQAKQFELLQQRLVQRWEAEVTRRWLEIQPLYAAEGPSTRVSDHYHADALSGPEVALAYFSHIDVLTYAILDLFKCSSAKGPGGNSGDSSPYLDRRGEGANGAQGGQSGFRDEFERRAGLGVDSTGRLIVETLTWQRFVMYLADCSPQTHTSAKLDGIRVFLPPKALRITGLSGANREACDGGIPEHPQREMRGANRNPRYIESFELGKVRIAKLWEEKGISILLTTLAKDGGNNESLYFINNSSMKCARVQPLSSRYGGVLTMEMVSSHQLLACSYIDGVRLYDIDTFVLKAFVSENNTVTAMRYLREVDRLVIGNKAGDVRFYSSIGIVNHHSSDALPPGDSKDVGIANERGSPKSATNQKITSGLKDAIVVENAPKQHSEAICEILPCVLSDGVVVTASLDASVSYYNVKTRASRRAVGDAVVLGATSIPALGLLFCFGVDWWPFVWSYNVVGSKPMSLAGGGSRLGAVRSRPSGIEKSGGGGPISVSSDRRHHTSRIVAVFALEAPRYAAVSLDANGGVRVWDLWRMCLLQSIDIGSSVDRGSVPLFKTSSECASAFTNYLFDRTRVRLYSFWRQRAFTIKYNKKDDLRTTLLASFDELGKSFILESNRQLVSVSKRAVTVWDLVTARVAITISVPHIFASLLLQTHGTSKQITNDGGGTSESSENSDDGSVDEGRRSRKHTKKAQGPDRSRQQYPGLDIVSSQVVESARTILLGLSCGGIVVCSLGNGSVICFIPPVPFFYGGTGLLSIDGLTAGQEIAAAARFAGDLSNLFYHDTQDILFMSGAGRTFSEFRGRRQELLADGTYLVDATAFLFHRYTGLLLVAEASGVVSAWVQQDLVLHTDSWHRVAHSVGDCQATDPYVSMIEIPHSPFFVAYDGLGCISVHRIDLDLESLKAGDDPHGYYMWPGTALTLNGNAETRVHKRFFHLARKYTNSLRDAGPKKTVFISRRSVGGLAKIKQSLDKREKSSIEMREMSGSILKQYRRKYSTPKRDRSLVRAHAVGDVRVPTESEPNFDLLHPSTKNSSPKRDGSSSSEGFDENRTFATELSKSSHSPNSPTEQQRTSSQRQRARVILLRAYKSQNIDSNMSSARANGLGSGLRNSLRGATTQSSRRSASQNANLTSNSVVKFGLCARWYHLRVNPALQPLSGPLATNVSVVTAMAYHSEYSLLYVGDELGFVTIYDLCLLVAGPREVACWDALVKKHWEHEQEAQEEGLQGVNSDTCASQPLPRFCPLGVTPHDGSFSGASVLKDCRTHPTCIRRVSVHTSSVTSINVTDGFFGSVHTTGLDGTLQCWTLFLQKLCGNLTLGEQTTRSALRYPSIKLDSLEGASILRAIDLDFGREDGPSDARHQGIEDLSLRVACEREAGRSIIGSRITAAFLEEKTNPIFMLPSQLVYKMPEFAVAVLEQGSAVSNQGKVGTARSSDPGGPCQPSALECAESESYLSERVRRALQHEQAPPHVKFARNPTTKVTISAMSSKECDILRRLVEARVPNYRTKEKRSLASRTCEKDAVDTSLSEVKNNASAANQDPTGRSLEDEGDGAASQLPQSLILTVAGLRVLTQTLYNRSSVYDDIPRPFNGAGATDVLQQPPYTVVMASVQKGVGEVDDLSLFADHLSQSQSLMQGMLVSPRNGLSESPRNRLAKPLSNIEAVVQYKDWCMAQHQLLEGYPPSHTNRSNLPNSTMPAPTGRPSENFQKLRMANVIQIFKDLHSASVGDIERGIELPNHASDLSHGIHDIAPRLLSKSKGSDAEDQRALKGTPLLPVGTTKGDPDLIDERIAIATELANTYARSGCLSKTNNLRGSPSVTGVLPPLLSPSLRPSRGMQLSRLKDFTAEERDSGSDAESCTSEESFDDEGWKRILDRQRRVCEKSGDAKQALASLALSYQQDFKKNKSKATTFASIRDEQLVGKVADVFDMGTAHSTLAFLLEKEQHARRQTHELGTSASSATGTFSPEDIRAYCDSFNKRQSLADLLDSAPSLATRLGRKGDTSAFRSDLAPLVVGRRQRRHGGQPNGVLALSAGTMEPMAQSARKEDVSSPYHSGGLLNEGRDSRKVRLAPLLNAHDPPGRPVSPYLLRKCTQEEFKDLLSNRMLAAAVGYPKDTTTVTDAQTCGTHRTEGDKRERLRNGLLPTIPVRRIAKTQGKK